MIDDDAMDAVGDVVEAVDHFFQMIIDLIAGDEGHRRTLHAVEIEVAQAGIVLKALKAALTQLPQIASATLHRR